MGKLKQYMNDELENNSKNIQNEFFKKCIYDIFYNYTYRNNLTDLELEFYNNIYRHDNDVSFYIMITDNQYYCNICLDSKEEFLKCVSCFKDKKYNLYFSPSMFDGWRLDSNVSNLDCLYVDIDDIDCFEDIDFTKYTQQQIIDFLIDNYNLDEFTLPDWVVSSGHGLHLYYLIDGLDFSNLDNYNLKNEYIKYLIYYFKSDSSCSNLSRVLRCPFSNNIKHLDDIRTTRLYKTNKYNDYDIKRLDFMSTDFETINNYIEQNKKEKVQKSLRTRQINKIISDSIVVNRKVKSKKSKNSKKQNIVTDVFDMSYITYQKNSKWRYKNIIYDLHNYFVRRNGDIVGYRNKFIFIMSLYLKRIGLSHDDCINYISKYVTDDFQIESLNVVDSVYEHNYKIKNKTISDWLDFNDNDMNNSYSYYTDEKVIQQMKLNSDKQNQKKKDQRGFKANKDFQIETVKNNLDMSREDLAIFLGVSIRTISNIKKLINN